MDRERWNRIEALLQAALDRQPAARAAFLSASCGADKALRREVDALLRREADGAFLSAGPILAAAAPAPSLTGRDVSHYRVGALIGVGGMGEVYEAFDGILRRTVALKALSDQFTGDPERVRRFEQEARAASQLNHPNIITIFEIFRDGDAHFIAAERVEGATLREMLSRTPSIDDALDIAIQICAALKAAHTAWIIHRDIKPENIMVRSD